jgi:hypothetical protein
MLAVMARRDCYVSVDIEADGPVPGPYSMLSIGMVVAGRYDGERFDAGDLDDTEQRFYAELRPISSEFDQAALEVSGLDRQHLERDGEDPAFAMTRAAAWVRRVARKDRAVFAAFPLGFDWMFAYWYFTRFAETGSPFGHSTHLDIKTLYSARAGEPIVRSIKRNMPADILGNRPHTHHALDDALEQAELLQNLLRWER